MRLPNRRPGKYTFTQFDLRMTTAKLTALKKKLTRLKAALPKAIQETQHYGENGDFSENAEYQIAKNRLRNLNRSIAELEYLINHAEVISVPIDVRTVQIGHTVTLTTDQGEQVFQILGSSETNPSAGIISYQSPLGAGLLGHAVNDTITLTVVGRAKRFTIKRIQ